MKENKKTQQKYERYEDTIMIMRQLFGTRLTSRPGYILLQDVIYKHLKENGKIYCEINQYLGEETKQLFQKFYQNVIIHKDISGNDRMLSASNQ